MGYAKNVKYAVFLTYWHVFMSDNDALQSMNNIKTSCNQSRGKYYQYIQGLTDALHR